VTTDNRQPFFSRDAAEIMPTICPLPKGPGGTRELGGPPRCRLARPRPPALRPASALRGGSWCIAPHCSSIRVETLSWLPPLSTSSAARPAATFCAPVRTRRPTLRRRPPGRLHGPPAAAGAPQPETGGGFESFVLPPSCFSDTSSDNSPCRWNSERLRSAHTVDAGGGPQPPAFANNSASAWSQANAGSMVSILATVALSVWPPRVGET